MADSRFLPDGPARATKGAAERIEQVRRRITADVEAKYAEQLAAAGTFRRLWLRRAIAREIRARLDEELEKIAPRSGLYFQQPRA